jgi:serine/threonine-protein kinase
MKTVVLPLFGNNDMCCLRRRCFIREADLASGLWHQNVVVVYDRGEHNGQLWIVTEFVDGTGAAAG